MTPDEAKQWLVAASVIPPIRKEQIATLIEQLVKENAELRKDRQRLISALTLHFQNHLTEVHPNTQKCNCEWWRTERFYCQIIDSAMEAEKKLL